MSAVGNCLKQDLWDLWDFQDWGNCLNRGLSRITRMTRIMGLVMVVGGNCLNCDLWDLVICRDFCGTKRLIGKGYSTRRVPTTFIVKTTMTCTL